MADKVGGLCLLSIRTLDAGSCLRTSGITYVPTRPGGVYPAAILDLLSRRTSAGLWTSPGSLIGHASVQHGVAEPPAAFSDVASFGLGWAVCQPCLSAPVVVQCV